jgi:GAF domain-containing protein
VLLYFEQSPTCLRPRSDYPFTEGQRLSGFRTMLGVPLLREGVPIAFMMMARTVVKPFTDKQIELATTFADQAVIAIENTRLFEEVQARNRDLTALARLASPHCGHAPLHHLPPPERP